MIIPKSFQLGGLRYRVSYVHNMDDRGEASTDHGWVHIRHGMPKHCDEMTYCHELIHLMLECSGRSDLSSNETLVETMATFLHQHNVTQRGSLIK